MKHTLAIVFLLFTLCGRAQEEVKESPYFSFIIEYDTHFSLNLDECGNPFSSGGVVTCGVQLNQNIFLGGGIGAFYYTLDESYVDQTLVYYFKEIYPFAGDIYGDLQVRFLKEYKLSPVFDYKCGLAVSNDFNYGFMNYPSLGLSILINPANELLFKWGYFNVDWFRPAKKGYSLKYGFLTFSIAWKWNNTRIHKR